MLPDDAVIAPAPVIVVEVLLADYPGTGCGRQARRLLPPAKLRHYLLVQTERRTVIHHRRSDEGDIHTLLVTAGTLDLDPPGLTLELVRIYS